MPASIRSNIFSVALLLPRASLTLVALLGTAAVSGCHDSTGPDTGFVVTGPIQNNTQAAIPADARVVVVWTVSSGTPDYGYVFGEGVLDRNAGTFRVQFDGPPPAEALNAGVLGIGLVVATTDHSLQNGDVLTDPPAGFVGITAEHAVIFVSSRQDAMQLLDWAAAFGNGYSVGVGVKVPGTFDKFEPASPSSAVLIVDDLANIEVVNWT